RRHIPRGREPLETVLLADLRDLGVLVPAELHPVLVLQVGHLAPRGLPYLVPLFLGDTDLRCPLLELDSVTSGFRRDLDQLARDVNVAVVVDSDLADDVGGLAGCDQHVTDRYGSRNRHAEVGRCVLGHGYLSFAFREDAFTDLADRPGASGTGQNKPGRGED